MASIHSRLLENLLETASDQAEVLLGGHDVASPVLERRISDLESSPLADKQLIAVALRLALDLGLASGIRNSLIRRFRGPVAGVVIETQRRAIENEVREKGLPMGLAGDYVDTLERRIAVPADELPDVLWNYASLYDDLWSDPRIGAGSATRRIMLAMVTALRVRSAQLVAARAPSGGFSSVPGRGMAQIHRGGAVARA